jgi:hypothetical protein
MSCRAIENQPCGRSFSRFSFRVTTTAPFLAQQRWDAPIQFNICDRPFGNLRTAYGKRTAGRFCDRQLGIQGALVASIS